MGVAGSKPRPNTNRRLTRKASSPSPVYPRAPPPSPRKTSSNRSRRSSSVSFSQVYFDPTLPVWTKYIQPALVGRERAIFYFANSKHYKRAPEVLVSSKVFRWFDLHWYDLTDFCKGQLDTEKSRMRFRFIKSQYEMEQTYDANVNYNIPNTESPRFEDYVEYADNTIALCIRADGLIEGFAILDAEHQSLKVDVICVGPKKSGVGRIMMEDFKRFTVATGHRTIELTAVSTAVGFYKKLGFVPVAEEDEDEDIDMVWTATR
jgi:hypothetical protein